MEILETKFTRQSLFVSVVCLSKYRKKFFLNHIAFTITWLNLFMIRLIIIPKNIVGYELGSQLMEKHRNYVHNFNSVKI